MYAQMYMHVNVCKCIYIEASGIYDKLDTYKIGHIHKYTYASSIHSYTSENDIYIHTHTYISIRIHTRAYACI